MKEEPETNALEIVWSEKKPTKTTDGLWVPILGSIAAGYNTYIDDYASGFVNVSREDAPRTGEDDRYFILQVTGDSMVDADIYQDDYILFKRTQGQPRVGDIVACRIDDDMATLKELRKEGKDTVLHAYNKNVPNLHIKSSEFDAGRAGIMAMMVCNLSRD